MIRVLLSALILMSTIASAQQAKPLEQLQKEEQINKAIAAIDSLQLELDKLVRKREAECRMAVGYQPFCDCVLADLPVAWTFSDYVAITTRSKQDNGYAKMDKERRSAYDMVAPIRDKCVRQINANK